MYDPEPNDNYNEWIELYNPTNQSINVSDWTITDNSAEDFLEGKFDHGNGTTIIPTIMPIINPIIKKILSIFLPQIQ